MKARDPRCSDDVEDFAGHCFAPRTAQQYSANSSTDSAARETAMMPMASIVPYLLLKLKARSIELPADPLKLPFRL